MKIFVAGAGGYIGIPLVDRLVKRGHQVVAFDMWWFGRPSEADLVIHGDIRTVQDSHLEGIDAVIDLAGLSNDASGDLNPALTTAINVEGAKRLADAANRMGVKRYVYSSSASVYGSNPEPNLTVDAVCRPQTAYAASKLKVEDHLHAITYADFRPAILRNGTVYGTSKRMRFDLVVNAMTRDAYINRVITVGGRGDQWRPFVHIDDVVDCFVSAVEKTGGYTINVVSENYQIAAIAGMVLSRFPECSVMWHSPPAPTDKRSYHVAPLVALKRRVPDGIAGVEYALRTHMIDPEDVTAWTVNWYKTLPEFQT